MELVGRLLSYARPASTETVLTDKRKVAWLDGERPVSANPAADCERSAALMWPYLDRELPRGRQFSSRRIYRDAHIAERSSRFIARFCAPFA